MTYYKYYLKKLTSNELGYRKGTLKVGQHFYISKKAAPFFPPLSAAINNDFVILEFSVEYREHPAYVNLVYHNDKHNREDGTRDEYRIYLTREIAPDDFYFKPDDIIVIERTGDNTYNLKRYRKGNLEFEKLDEIIAEGKLNGQHALTNILSI